MKKTIRLTESDLHRIVKESVGMILNERTYEEAMAEEYNEYKNYVLNLYSHLLEAKEFLEHYEHDGLWRYEAKWIYPAVVDAIYQIKDHIEDEEEDIA